jgi:hypothetical protein
MTIKQSLETVGGLSAPSKMPCYGYSIPACHCITGSKLWSVPGTVCFNCYARKGRYMFRNVREALERRFQSLHDPDWTSSMAYLIKERKMEFFRWHDSGDLQGVWHLSQIAQVAALTPDCSHWLPTRETRIVKSYLDHHTLPDNLTVRISAMAFDKQAPLGFARKHGLTVSGASSNGSHTCPAPDQGNTGFAVAFCLLCELKPKKEQNDI